mgnify:CR=1 FL=1
MERNASCKGIVLRNFRIGEIHKGVVLLTDRFGLVSSIAHGAYSQKGKLRGVTNLFCTGTFYLYHNPAKNSTKITDVQIDAFHQDIRSDLSAFYAASLWSEVVIKSYGGGDDGRELWRLLVRALEAVDAAAVSPGGHRVSLISVQFLWRYLAVIGVRPDLGACAATGAGLEVAERASYSRMHGGFVSPEFTEASDISLSRGARRYLEHTQELSLDRALLVRLDPESLSALKRALFAMVQDTVESPLNTLRIGEGFL